MSFEGFKFVYGKDHSLTVTTPHDEPDQREVDNAVAAFKTLGWSVTDCNQPGEPTNIVFIEGERGV